MRTVDRSALVPYSAQQMFDLVDDVAAYPDFLPWCAGTDIHERTAQGVDATIRVQKAGLRQSFRTRNRNERPEHIEMQLVDGPFSRLAGGWQFDQLGDDGCRAALSLEFEFRDGVSDALFGRLFESICNTLVDAFVQRAHTIYGRPDS